jgi:hypothetical protein
MTPKRCAGRLLTAASMGLAFIAACAGAAPTGTAQAAWTPDPEADPAARRGPDKTAPGPADAGPSQIPGPDAAPRCPYGALEDPHRGFVRCLLPEERDAGWLPPPPQGDAPPAESPRAEPPADAGAPAALPTVEIGAPKFENGEVTKVEKSLGKASGEMSRCVAEHGGLGADVGTLKVQFLVRFRGRAEGVEIVSAKGVSAEASACVRRLLKNKAIGAPTADPVGVTVTLTFKPTK